MVMTFTPIYPQLGNSTATQGSFTKLFVFVSLC